MWISGLRGELGGELEFLGCAFYFRNVWVRATRGRVSSLGCRVPDKQRLAFSGKGKPPGHSGITRAARGYAAPSRQTTSLTLSAWENHIITSGLAIGLRDTVPAFFYPSCTGILRDCLPPPPLPPHVRVTLVKPGQEERSNVRHRRAET